MPTNYKILGQTSPSAGSETLNYAVPSTTSTLVRSINVTNRSATADTYSISLLPSTFIPPAPVLVALGNNTTFASYSTDGITWTATSIPNGRWNDVAYGLGTYFAIPSGGATTGAARSTDGITWSAVTMPANIAWSATAFGNNLFVALAGPFGMTTTAATSTDAITWTLTTMPSASEWCSVMYGNNRFVAVSSYPGTSVAYSTNGTTWTESNWGTSGNWRSVAYGNGRFVAVGSSPSDQVASSTDGITWTLTSVFSGSRYAVVFGNSKFVALHNNQTSVSISTDGITWSVSTLPGSLSVRAAAFYKSRFVVSGSTTTTVYHSTDAITWTASTMPSLRSWYIPDLSPEPANPTTASYIAFETPIAGSSTVTMKAGYTLQSPNNIRVTSTNGTSTFSTFGAEIS